MDIKLDVNKAMSDIAEELGIAVEKIYPILYKQAIVDGVYNLVSLIFIIFIWWFIYKVSKGSIKAAKKEYKENGSRWSDSWIENIFDKHMFLGFVGIFFCIGTIMLGVFTAGFVPKLIKDIATAFFNTDYYIIKDVIDKIK